MRRTQTSCPLPRTALFPSRTPPGQRRLPGPQASLRSTPSYLSLEHQFLGEERGLLVEGLPLLGQAGQVAGSTGTLDACERKGTCHTSAGLPGNFYAVPTGLSPATAEDATTSTSGPARPGQESHSLLVGLAGQGRAGYHCGQCWSGLFRPGCGGGLCSGSPLPRPGRSLKDTAVKGHKDRCKMTASGALLGCGPSGGAMDPLHLCDP